MSRLVLTNELLTRLRAEVLQNEEETCALLFGQAVGVSGKLARIVIRDSVTPPLESYIVRNATQAQLNPQIVAEAAQRARQTRQSIIFVHSHPFSFNHFSQTDDAGEVELSNFLQ